MSEQSQALSIEKIARGPFSASARTMDFTREASATRPRPLASVSQIQQTV